MVQRIKIGIRPSLLAFKQAQEIQKKLPDTYMDIVQIKTSGDLDKTTPLCIKEKSDFFTDEIEQALLKGDIEAAIHSAKDLEEKGPEELAIVALTESVSPYDCLVSQNNLKLNQLPPQSRVGTSSQARKQGIVNFRSDLVVKDIRGNVDDRIRQLDNGDFEAIIVADAALIRLGLQRRISECINEDIIKPHPLQGRLAVQIKKSRSDLRKVFEVLDGK